MVSSPLIFFGPDDSVRLTSNSCAYTHTLPASRCSVSAQLSMRQPTALLGSFGSSSGLHGPRRLPVVLVCDPSCYV